MDKLVNDYLAGKMSADECIVALKKYDISKMSVYDKWLQIMWDYPTLFEALCNC